MRRMFIVDDEPKLCECLAQFFTAKGLAVRFALSGEEALERLMDEPAEVILLDMRLPDLPGTEVLKRARELCPGAKIIMVTAVDEEEPQLDAEAYGACGYIRKPFDFSDSTWGEVLRTDRDA